MAKNRNMAMASFILGLFFWMPLFNMILGPIAIFLGIKALIKIKKQPKKYTGKWYAISGIILGWIPIFLWIVQLVMMAFGIEIKPL